MSVSEGGQPPRGDPGPVVPIGHRTPKWNLCHTGRLQGPDLPSDARRSERQVYGGQSGPARGRSGPLADGGHWSSKRSLIHNAAWSQPETGS